jgi:hypothetical protein
MTTSPPTLNADVANVHVAASILPRAFSGTSIMLTVIAVYDEFQPAQSAKNEVLAAGFSWTQVQLNPDHEVHHEPRPATPHTDDPSVYAGISTFVRSLFGVGDKSTHSNVYAEAVRRGGYVLTVDVDGDEPRMRVEEIMNRFHPVDLQERSADWMQHGWRGHDPGSATGGGKLRTIEGEPPRKP